MEGKDSQWAESGARRAVSTSGTNNALANQAATAIGTLHSNHQLPADLRLAALVDPLQTQQPCTSSNTAIAYSRAHLRLEALVDQRHKHVLVAIAALQLRGQVALLLQNRTRDGAPVPASQVRDNRAKLLGHAAARRKQVAALQP